MAVAFGERSTTQDAILSLKRDDIVFRNLTENLVRIEVTVRNLGEARTQSTFMSLSSAPLGAFLPWTPLASLSVPAIGPGEALQIQTDVERPRVTALGDWAQVPPRTLLTAVSAGDESQWVGAGRLSSNRQRSRLAPDLFEYLGHRNPHWAGNLNVFIGERPVERHMARALRIYPGRGNLAMFIVGRRQDAYSFELVGYPLAEHAALFAVGGRAFLMRPNVGQPIPEHEWLDTREPLIVILAMDVPESCQAGTLDVHVCQRSTGHEAVVEFDLDPAAAGPGCYTM